MADREGVVYLLQGADEVPRLVPVAEVVKSAGLFVRGPAWRVFVPVSAAFGIFGAVQEAKSLHLGSIWMWLFFGSLGLVAAAFLTYHRQRTETEAKKRSLPRQIDDLHREGIKLYSDLAVPYEPDHRNGVTTIVGDPPEDKWNRAEAFDHRIRDLFHDNYPTLMTDYADAFNACLRKLREKRAAEAPDPETDTRDDGQKMLDFARYTHSQPAVFVEGALSGLAAARHRVAASPLILS
jgi:hypothetical protein